MNTQTLPFQAEVTKNESRITLTLIGEINGLADKAITAAYEEAQGLALAGAAHSGIELDFTQVDYINSTGIALVVGLLAKARAEHIPLSAVGLSDHYREIFTITRLSDFIEIK